jgi:hypothetical protein
MRKLICITYNHAKRREIADFTTPRLFRASAKLRWSRKTRSKAKQGIDTT